MPGQSSFRRILLTRILLLSIPILLLGVAVTFRKARTSLLDTARQNLQESAMRKGDTIRSEIEALQTSLAIASETTVLQAGSTVATEQFLQYLAEQLPTDVQCLQLVAIETNQPAISTCGSQPAPTLTALIWPLQQPTGVLPPYQLQINTSRNTDQARYESRLNLEIAVPVYDAAGQLRYSLVAQSILSQMENSRPWSLLGYTTVIDEDGTFLAHPIPGRLGTNIVEADERERYDDMLDNALRNEQGTRHLFNFDGSEREWLAGFDAVQIPITPTETRTWVVLAVARLDYALYGLKAITQILFLLTTGLLAAHLLAMLYMARDLALPIEQLGKYARHIHRRNPNEQAPKNFRIRELNHLAEVLDHMVRRLEERAQELETAWQEAEAANRLKSEFLANTSHELRTPLNAIIGCLRLVQDGSCDSDEEEQEFLQQADKAAVHLLKIINDLLDIRRIEEKALPLCIELLDLRQVLGEVIELQRVHLHQKGLELHFPALTEPILVQADPARLKQVLINVVYNAIKFTDQGGITVEVQLQATRLQDSPKPPEGTVAAALASSTWVVLRVQDTGIGIDPSQQQKLFRPFYQVDGTTTRKFEGTGLGLAISRNLIEMMGGTIALKSAGVSQGTTVEIILPVVEAPPGPLLPGTTVKEAEAKRGEADTEPMEIIDDGAIALTSALEQPTTL